MESVTVHKIGSESCEALANALGDQWEVRDDTTEAPGCGLLFTFEPDGYRFNAVKEADGWWCWDGRGDTLCAGVTTEALGSALRLFTEG
jgi:hypothetical protein